jgi:hypothetical protein
LAEVHSACTSCGSLLTSELLSCPACHQLVHAAALEALAQEARTQETGSPAAAAELWRKALILLPPESKQAEAIRDRVASLGAAARLAGDPAQKPVPGWLKRFGTLGVAVAVSFSKLKFLLLGLGKFKTLRTMLASMGLLELVRMAVRCRFRTGDLRPRNGPCVGTATVRPASERAHVHSRIWSVRLSLYDSPANVGQDARIGLAGPLWGAAAAITFLLPRFWFRAQAFMDGPRTRHRVDQSFSTSRRSGLWTEAAPFERSIGSRGFIWACSWSRCGWLPARGSSCC